MRTRPELQGCGPDRKYASPSNLSGLPRRQRNRTAIILVMFALSLLLLTACEKKEEKPKPGPPEVLVAEVVQQDVPIFQRVGGATERPGECRDHAQGAGLPAQAGLPERILRQEGPAPVRARPAAVRGRAGPGQGAGGSGASESREGNGRRATRYAAGRAERDPAKAARYRPCQPGCHARRKCKPPRPPCRTPN